METEGTMTLHPWVAPAGRPAARRAAWRATGEDADLQGAVA
jgi:hypothetical protein